MNPKIYIKGPRIAVNEALADYISRNLKLGCCSIHMQNRIEKDDPMKTDKVLLLIDCAGMSSMDIESFFGERFVDPNANYDVAFINVDAQLKGEIENQVYHKRLVGFFYEDTPLHLLLKGIRTIMAGELWLSRETMSKLITNMKDKMVHTDSDEIYITKREKEILNLIASGWTNDEISDTLSISSHTVKTHIQNLYKKIGVSNRLQAAFFATNRILSP